MGRVFLNVGSNTERERHLCIGLDALAATHGELRLSSVYESGAVGFNGAPFLNLAVAIETRMPVGELHRWLRELEYAHGRPADANRFSSRTLDIDILTYDDRVGLVDGVELPRPEILENAFVLGPLAELAPGVLHPVAARTYADLWADYDRARQPLQAVDFSWGERCISRADPTGIS